jgi:hypothetical protein
MFAATDVLMTLHLLLLLGLLGITSAFLLVTVTNRLRLRRILLSWRCGRAFGFPALPLAADVLLLAGLIASIVTDQRAAATLLTGYLTAGSFWLAAATLAKTVLVTDYGIIINVNSQSRTIAWGQISDYFEHHSGRRTHYVFFYSDGTGIRRRLSLDVPARYKPRLEAAVAAKLDSRFEFVAQQAYGKTAMEG